MSENTNTNTKYCTYCSEEIDGDDHKKIVRFNQPESILNNFRELTVCNNCIAIRRENCWK